MKQQLKVKSVPRGIRNNNPLNIRHGNVWLGEVKNPTDPEFEQFVSMEYGLRAGFIILRRYIRRYHHDTVASIISTWAPACENNVDSYISHVSSIMSIDPNCQLKFEDKDVMVSLVCAMVMHECGVNIDPKKASMGYDLA